VNRRSARATACCGRGCKGNRRCLRRQGVSRERSAGAQGREACRPHGRPAPVDVAGELMPLARGCEPRAFAKTKGGGLLPPPLLFHSSFIQRYYSMLDWLKAYYLMGWALLPCSEKTKAPLTAHGYNDASTDWQTIEAWHRQFPDSVWAVGTSDSHGV